MPHTMGTFTIRLLGDGSLELRTRLNNTYVVISDNIFDGIRVYHGHHRGTVTLHKGMVPGATFHDDDPWSWYGGY